MNVCDELWVLICNNVLQKTVSSKNTVFCTPIGDTVYRSSIMVVGNKVKVKHQIFSSAVICKKDLHAFSLLFKHSGLSDGACRLILVDFAKNYVDDIFKDNYVIEDDYWVKGR